MRKTIEVHSAEISSGMVILNVECGNLSEFNPKGQMLVDSDKLAFIYILESKDDYAYVYIAEEIWIKIVGGLKDKIQVILRNKEESMVLSSFMEELDYLIDNIKDNANYGDNMVRKIEQVFM